MRNLSTSTGRKQHIVRENAYHGQYLGPPALCGVHANKFPDGSFAVGAPDAPDKRRCGNCRRLYEQGAR